MKHIVPTLDLADGAAGSPRRAAYLDELRRAVTGIGIFNLVNYGPAVAQAHRLLAAAAEFFALPESERLAVALAKSRHFRGYSGVELHWADEGRSRREQFDVGVELAARPVDELPRPCLLIEGPNQWPAGLPSLRGVVTAWMAQLDRLARRLLADLLAALDAPAGHLDPVLDRPHAHLKLLHYVGGDASTEIGLNEHQDTSLITLLLQDDSGGLQVRTDDGEFIAVPWQPDAVVVNLGELMAGATGGYARAAVHRVLCPAPGDDRLSAPFFFAPRLDSAVPGLRTRYCDQPEHTPAAGCYGDVVINGLCAYLPDLVELHYPDHQRRFATHPR